MKIKTDDSSFNRDCSNHALINTNAEAYSLYKQRRVQQKNHNDLQGQIDNLKGDLDDIKSMLSVLIRRENNGNSNI